MPALVFKIVQEDPVPVHRLNVTLNWTVDTVLKRALAKNPAERYPTCSDFVFALENACVASKNWKPIAPGVLPDLPTVAPPGHAAAASPAERAISAPDTQPEPAPKLLRRLRVLAAVVFSACLVLAVWWGALEYFSDDAGTVAQVQQEPADPVENRPSPMPPVVEAPKPEPVPPEQRERREPEPASTRFVTNPPGAFLVVDGASALSCTSPCTLDLTPGRHTLAATKEGYRRTLKILQIPSDQDVFLNLDAAVGTVFIRSEPDGASIYVDGQLRTERTPARLTLPTGSHSIEIVRNGARETRQVVVTDSITNVSVDLSQ
jgi:hypothetical protein